MCKGWRAELQGRVDDGTGYMITAFFVAIERWVDSGESDLLAVGKMFLVIGVALALIFGPPVWWIQRSYEAEQATAQAQCLESGGGWAIVGHHPVTTTMLVGKVVIPTTSTVTDYGCVKVAP